MANGLWGSICIEDLFGAQVAQSQDGRKWVCLDALTQEPFQKSDKNGKHYAKVQIWINDEPDQFQNAASMSLSQSQDQRNAGQKRVYIGNLKWNQAHQPAAPVQGGYPPAQQYQQPAQQYQQPPATFPGGGVPAGYPTQPAGPAGGGAYPPAYGNAPQPYPQAAPPQQAAPQVNGGTPMYSNDLPF